MKWRIEDKPLRRDVRLLGRLLGEVLSREEGTRALELEERIRTLAIDRRRGPRAGRKAAAKELRAILRSLSLEEAELVIRAFAVYFQLANVAEQHHRVRRARAHETEAAAPPQRGSLREVLHEAKVAGVPAHEARAAIAALEVTLTLTAHPTQALRGTVLERLGELHEALEARDRGGLTRPEAQRLDDELREQVLSLWQTDELRRQRPTVGDEVRHILWYVEEVLIPLVPEVPRRLSEAFEEAYGEPLGMVPSPLRIHSWVGGDMDGNPFVTPEVLEDTIRAHNVRALRRHLHAVERLGRTISASSRQVIVPPALLRSIAADEERLPAVAAQHKERSAEEPFRYKLRFVEARVEATLVEALRRRGLPGGDAPVQAGAVYHKPDELLHDLLVIADAMRASGAAGERLVRDAIETVRATGFHVAELEVRAPAEDARDAAKWLSGQGPRTDGAARLLGTLAKIAQAQRDGGERACRTFILSMAQSADDCVAALRCARDSGLWDAQLGCARVDIVPLFETLEALQKGPQILRELLAHPEYGHHARARGVQEVMVGYSDSGKEVGLFAATGALRRAQEELPRVAREAGIPLRLFHGRGESVARGGGPAQQAILALPAGSVGGRYKATEQGEAMDHKYARPELATRTLDLVIGGALSHTLGVMKRAPALERDRFWSAFDRLAEDGRVAYRALVWDTPAFIEFFSAATPIDAISRLNIGSRPAKRRAGGVESLRAIPWVFAWTQNRAILPAWYGVGSAFAAAEARGETQLLLDMAHRWPFFQTVLSNVEMVLAKTDLQIAQAYAELAPKAARDAVWPRIKAEHKLTVDWVKRLTGSKKLLEKNPSLQRSIALRNPYVDPMSFLQVELLRRFRAGDDHTDRPLLLSLAGIAAGMRNTG